ncbi:hypothetical protein LTS08_000753 [Lithohypha guttulata]|nr:hypothetical protein LTS08_000753 [Lithohypha guttulata]
MTQSKQAHIVAIFTPKPDKVERVGQLLENQCRSVHAKEPYCLRFVMTQRTNLEDNQVEFVLVETYEDRDSIDRHTQEDHFKEMSKAFSEEDGGLLAKKPYIAFTRSVAGFEFGRELIK